MSAPAPSTASDASQQPPSRAQRAALALALVVFGSANAILFGVFPLAARGIGLAEWQIGLIFTFSAIGIVLLSPFWGRFSDRHGRRPVIVNGMAAYGVGSLAFGVWLHFGLNHAFIPLVAWLGFIACRVGMTVFMGGVFPAAQAFIADRSPPERRASALSGVIAAFALGNVVGPAAAAALVPLGFSWPYYVSALAGVGAAFAVWRLLPREQPNHAARQGPRLSPTDKRVRRWIAICFGYFICIGGSLQILGFIIQDSMRVDIVEGTRWTSYMLMLNGLVAVIFQVSVLRRLHLNARTMLAIGLTSSVLTFACLGFARAEWQFLILGVPFGLSFACVMPGFSAAASLAVRTEEQGAIAGLIGSAQAGGFLVGPALFSALYQWQPMAPLALATAICLGLLIASQRRDYS